MVKIKKEIWVERCDFCEEEKKHVCALCGNDVCDKHTLHLTIAWTPPSAGMVFYFPTKIIDYFCPNHLSGELLDAFEKKVQGLESKARDRDA